MKNQYRKVHDEIGYVKDTVSRAILNINKNEVFFYYSVRFFRRIG